MLCPRLPPPVPLRLSERQRQGLLLLVGLVLGVTYALMLRIYFPAHDMRGPAGTVVGQDFLVFWAAARVALTGSVAILPQIDQLNAFLQSVTWPDLPWNNWSYPPHMLLALTPLGLLSYPAALVVWTLGGMLCLLAALNLIVPARQWPRWFIAALLLSPPVVINVLGGQNGLWTATLALLVLHWAKPRPWLAGMALAFLSMKPHMALIVGLALLMGRYWRSVIWAAPFTAILIFLSFAFYGLQAWHDFFFILVPHQTSMLWGPVHRIYMGMMTSPLVTLRVLGASDHAALGAQIVISLLTLGWMGWALRQASDTPQRALILAVAAPLTLPYYFSYDLCMLSAALVLAWLEREPPPARYALRLLATLAAMASVCLSTLGGTSWPAVPMLLIMAIALHTIYLRQSSQ